MNAEVKVSMSEDDDNEQAQIRIRSWGMVSELRFGDRTLNAVASFTSLDIKRLLETIKEAEAQRIDPNPEMIRCIERVMDGIDYLDEEKSRLYLQVEAEMPIASCGSVLLEPNFNRPEEAK